MPQYIAQNAHEIGKVLVVLTTKTLELREEEDDDEDDDEEIEDEGKEKQIIADIQKLKQKDDDDEEYFPDEDENYDYLYDCPLQDQDEIIHLEQTLLKLKDTNPDLYNLLIAGLNKQEQEKLDKNINEAKLQYQEWLKNKSQPHQS